MSKTLQLTCVKGRDLAAKDSNGKSDPYVKVKIAGMKKKTQNPEWNETFYFDNVDERNAVELTVMDWDRIGSHDFMGCVTVPGADLVAANQGTVEKWYPLQKKKAKDDITGDILLRMLFREKPSATFDPKNPSGAAAVAVVQAHHDAPPPPSSAPAPPPPPGAPSGRTTSMIIGGPTPPGHAPPPPGPSPPLGVDGRRGSFNQPQQPHTPSTPELQRAGAPHDTPPPPPRQFPPQPQPGAAPTGPQPPHMGNGGGAPQFSQPPQQFQPPAPQPPKQQFKPPQPQPQPQPQPVFLQPQAPTPQPPLPQPPPRTLPAASALPRARIEYDFAPENPGEITASAGAIMDVLEIKGEWMKGRLPDGVEGWIPSNYCTQL